MTENGNHDKKKSSGENSNIITEKPDYLKKGMKRKLSKPFEEEPPKRLANIHDKDIDSSSSKLINLESVTLRYHTKKCF